MTRVCKILFVFLLLSNLSSAQLQRVNFENWNFRNVKDTNYLPATVPGTVHTDLLANGIIEDPFYRDNEKKVQWIEKEDWVYKTEFDFENTEEKIDLVFEGLDTYANVFINGQKVLNAENMFRGYRVKDFQKYLAKGNNILEVLFRSPIAIEDSLSKIFYQQTGISKLPETGRIFTRKAAYHYGWDWSPRFVTCGIWRNVYMEVYKAARISDVYIQQTLSDDYKKAILTFNVGVSGSSDKTYEFNIINKSESSVSKYSFGDYFSLTIDDPKLWWCNGQGEPYLYEFDVILKNNNSIIDKKTVRAGIRKIELIQEDDSIGRSFYFKLNGVPVFMKGANYIPPDNFMTRVTKEKYKDLIRTAKETNMNMLRVWGGGVYEDDEFYNQCDENGILVWQDFMFACAMYPWDNNFLSNVSEEAEYNVVRLRNHPCIALWCGNNENDEGWQNWGWQNNYNAEQKEKIWDGYISLFQKLLPSLVDIYASHTPYVSTSPQIGWGHKESMTHGDSHYWGVWWGMERFDTLTKKVPRFMSEYGFQSFPDTSTINRFTEEKDRYLFSDVLKTHQKHPTGFENLTKYMQMYIISTNDYSQFIKNTQNLQINCLKTAIEAQRLAKPYCMGTLLWQFNDCNPVISWSVLDYYGTPKPALKELKDLYNNVLLVVKEEKNIIKIHIVNDYRYSLNGNLYLVNENNDTLKTISVELKPDSSEKFLEIERESIIKDAKTLNVILKLQNNETFSKRLYL